MDTLLFLAKLALALWLLYNVGVYAWRRQGNRRSSERFRNIAGPGRALTAAEHATLRAWLANPREPGGVPELLRDGQAFALEGDYARHGLRQQLGATMHDTLAGLDVSLPYDAKDFLQPRNTAEVVLTARYAVVVMLNGRFDIASARERAVAANRQKFIAANPDTPLPDVDPALAAADLAMLGFEPLGQREESLAERTARSTTSLVDDIVVGCVLTLALASLAFGSSSPDDASVEWIGIGVALLAVGAWRWARSNALRAPQAVHRVRGRLSRTTLTNTAGPAGGMFRLGHRFSVDAPLHWARFINPPALEPVDFEIRADGSIVRYRDALSVDAESTRFPHRPGRSLKGVGVAAGIALFLALGGYRHLGRDFEHAHAWIAGTPPAVVTRGAAPLPVDAASAAEQSSETEAGTAPAIADSERDARDDARWATFRAAFVVSTLVLALACGAASLGQALAARSRRRRLETLADEHTRRCAETAAAG